MIQDLFVQYIAKTTESVSLLQERELIEGKIKSVRVDRFNIKKEVKDFLASLGEKGSYTFLFEKDGQQVVVNVDTKVSHENNDFLTFRVVTPLEKFTSKSSVSTDSEAVASPRASDIEVARQQEDPQYDELGTRLS